MKKLERENFEKNFFPPMGGKTPLVGREVLTITYGKHVPIMGPTPIQTFYPFFVERGDVFFDIVSYFSQV